MNLLRASQIVSVQIKKMTDHGYPFRLPVLVARSDGCSYGNIRVYVPQVNRIVLWTRIRLTTNIRIQELR